MACKCVWVDIFFFCYCWCAVLSRCREGEPPPSSSPLLWPGDVQQLFTTKEGRSLTCRTKKSALCWLTAVFQPFFQLLGILLSASGPAAFSNMWHCGETHRAPCASGLCPVGLHPLLWPLHLLLSCTPGIQSTARQPAGVFQHLLKWAAAGGSIPSSCCLDTGVLLMYAPKIHSVFNYSISAKYKYL